MRRSKMVLAGLLGFTAIAACGMPVGTPGVAPTKVSGPQDAVRRYQVLNGVPACTPTPSGTASPASCDAFAGRGGIVLFTVVDDGPGSDPGQAQFGHGEFEYIAINPTVEQGLDAFDNRIVVISATFSPVYTGPPTDPTPTADPVAATITVNLDAATYTLAVPEDGTFNDSQGFQVLIAHEDSCTPIPTSDLFPD